MADEWLHKEAGRLVLRFGRRDETSLLLIDRAAPATPLFCPHCSVRSMTVALFPPEGETTDAGSMKTHGLFHGAAMATGFVIGSEICLPFLMTSLPIFFY